MGSHAKRHADARQMDHNYTPMVEPRMNGEQPRQYEGSTERPAECLDDRPHDPGPPTNHAGETITVMDSKFGRAVADEANDVNPGAALRANPGAALRAAREARGLSIEDLSRTTKIGGAVLIALEETNVDRLPATIFTRGFLKAYAKEVRLDPDETADLYLAHAAPATLAVDGAEARLKVASPAQRHEVLASDDDTSRFLAERQVGRLGWFVLAAAVVGLTVYIWSFNWERSSDTLNTQLAQQAPGDATPASATPSAAGDVARAMIETPIGPLQFQLTTRGPCWLAAAADGQPVFARLLQAGEQETIEVHDELILRVGDPGALTISINGMEGRPLGRTGEPVNVRITKGNFREFLGS